MKHDFMRYFNIKVSRKIPIQFYDLFWREKNISFNTYLTVVFPTISVLKVTVNALIMIDYTLPGNQLHLEKYTFQ